MLPIETVKAFGGAVKLHNRLMVAELDGSLATDCRRLMSEERQLLGIALQQGNGAKIAERAREALRVARMWGVIEEEGIK